MDDELDSIESLGTPSIASEPDFQQALAQWQRAADELCALDGGPALGAQLLESSLDEEQLMERFCSALNARLRALPGNQDSIALCSRFAAAGKLAWLAHQKQASGHRRQGQRLDAYLSNEAR